MGIVNHRDALLLSPGIILNERYEVIGPLGSNEQGGQGTEVVARDKRLKQIKILKFGNSESIIKQYKFHHLLERVSCVPNTQDRLSHEDLSYLVLSFGEGTSAQPDNIFSLHQALRTSKVDVDNGYVSDEKWQNIQRFRDSTLEQRIEFYSLILQGVSDVHAEKVVHSDLHPKQIILFYHPEQGIVEHVHLIDYGTAIHLKDEETIRSTSGQQFETTYLYNGHLEEFLNILRSKTPEIEKNKLIDAIVKNPSSAYYRDYYALGIIAFECLPELSRKHPYEEQVLLGFYEREAIPDPLKRHKAHLEAAFQAQQEFLTKVAQRGTIVRPSGIKHVLENQFEIMKNSDYSPQQFGEKLRLQTLSRPRRLVEKAGGKNRFYTFLSVATIAIFSMGYSTYQYLKPSEADIFLEKRQPLIAQQNEILSLPTVSSAQLSEYSVLLEEAFADVVANPMIDMIESGEFTSTLGTVRGETYTLKEDWQVEAGFFASSLVHLGYSLQEELGQRLSNYSALYLLTRKVPKKPTYGYEFIRFAHPLVTLFRYASETKRWSASVDFAKQNFDLQMTSTRELRELLQKVEATANEKYLIDIGGITYYMASLNRSPPEGKKYLISSGDSFWAAYACFPSNRLDPEVEMSPEIENHLNVLAKFIVRPDGMTYDRVGVDSFDDNEPTPVVGYQVDDYYPLTTPPESIHYGNATQHVLTMKQLIEALPYDTTGFFRNIVKKCIWIYEQNLQFGSDPPHSAPEFLIHPDSTKNSYSEDFFNHIRGRNNYAFALYLETMVNNPELISFIGEDRFHDHVKRFIGLHEHRHPSGRLLPDSRTEVMFDSEGTVVADFYALYVTSKLAEIIK